MGPSTDQVSYGLAVVSLWAPDEEVTAAFYRDVVGLKLASHHGTSYHFDLGGPLLAVLRGAPHPATEATPERFPVVAFKVDDLERALDRLRVANVATPWGVEERAGVRWVMFHDPAGNLLEFVELS